MSCERIFGPSVLTSDRVQPLGSAFQALWPAAEGGGFGRFLKRIDEAFVQRRSHMRIVRLNRMLERDYSV